MNDNKLLSVMRKGIEKYKMIKDGDRIAVGVSGGKDSLLLLRLLAEYSRFSPEKFTVTGISVDLRFDGQDTDYTEIENFCRSLGVEFIAERTDIGAIVFKERKEKSPCALCSKMRKGALYETAKKHGCNKVALGHHANDLEDTFILSLLYEGRLSAFAPKSYLDRTGLTLIRPMIMIEESDVIPFAKELPVITSKCPADKNTKRAFVKSALKELSKYVPNARDMIYTALTHPERYNLFDKFERQTDEF